VPSKKQPRYNRFLALALLLRDFYFMKLITSLNTALQNGLSKKIFDHIRNFLICAVLLAMGTSEIKNHSSLLFGFISSQQSGFGVVGFAGILIALNLYDGIRELSKSRYQAALTIGLVMLYVFLSLRVIEMAWNYHIV
jgi:hypothetical protein